MKIDPLTNGIFYGVLTGAYLGSQIVLGNLNHWETLPTALCLWAAGIYIICNWELKHPAVVSAVV